MRPCCSLACLLVTWCLVSSCFAADDEEAAAGPLPLERLSRQRAAQILDNSSELADSLVRQIKSLRSPAESAVADDIRDTLSHPAQWQWFYRDHGLLLGIPVNERLGAMDSYYGEKVLADVIRRLISQKGWGNPRVQVVLVEPQLPPPASGSAGRCTHCATPNVNGCLCP